MKYGRSTGMISTRILYRRVFVAFLALTCAAWAQTDQATLRGAARDQTGAVVPNTAIEVTNIETNITRAAKSNDAGDFEIPYLNPGTYRMTASAPGFKTFVAEQIVLVAREVRRLDAALEIGAVGSEVTVTAGAAVIQTEGAQIASGFTEKSYLNSALSIPTFPQAFMTTLPNIQTDQGGFGLRFAGQTQVTETLDGVPSDGAVNLVQNMLDTQDLQVVAVNNSAEYSRVATFTLAGRSGTNSLHGMVIYNFLNSALNARNTFAAKKPPSKEHDGYVEVAGPIRKDRTFFYSSYDHRWLPSKTFYNRNVPLSSFRNGDFSSLLSQAKPVIVKDPLTGQPFPGNVIPSNRINATAAKIQSQYIPTPNQGAPNATFQNYGFLFPYPVDLLKWDSFTERVDHRLSDKNTIFARYVNRITPYILAGNFPDVGTWTRKRFHHSVVISDTHIFSPSLINTARWGWIKDHVGDGEEVSGVKPVTGDTVVQALGLQGVNPNGFKAQGFPTIDITGVDKLSEQPGGVVQDRRDFSYADSVTWSRGRHVMKFGGELRTFRDFVSVVPDGTYGNFVFNGSLTGAPYADFLLGLPFSSTRLNPVINREPRAYELGLFATDTFKISSKLTVDYGLRWDFFGAATYKDGLMYNWDPKTGNVIVPQAALSKISPLYPTNSIHVVAGQVAPNSKKTNFRPRIGAAYRLSNDFVIRGGYGQYTEYLGSNIPRLQGTGPFQLGETFFNSLTGSQPLFSFPNPFPAGAGSIASQSISGYPVNTDNGVIHQFNLTIERQIASVGFRASYIGSRSRGLNYTLALNKPQPGLTPFSASRRPYSQFVGASFAYSDGKANYDSVQIEAQRKFSGFTFDAHYTLASNLNNFSNLENPYDHNFWNRDSFTSRHRAVITAVYDLPFGSGKKYLSSASGTLNQVVGGWVMNWISYFQSGQYFSPSFSGSDPSNTNTSGGLPDRIGNGNISRDQRNRDHWFDAGAFVTPPPGRFGNSGVNVLQGPGLNLHHLSVVKSFRLSERFSLQYQALISDIFNRPHYQFPLSNISVPGQVGRLFSPAGGGSSREMSAERDISMRLRLEF